MERSSSATKKHLNLVVIGHVDSGKSTTTGHLLYKCGDIDARTVQKLEEEAKERNKASFKFAYIMNKLVEERKRGITIDISTFSFNTEKYHFSIIDCPGHRDFVKNMITGTSQADAAFLVVSAAKGEFEAGIASDGQTKEHALLAYTLGVKQLIVLVNKMDAPSVEYSQERFNEIKKEVSTFLAKVGYNPKKIPFIPVSGWNGENLIEPSENLPWYKGPIVLKALDELLTPRLPVDKPLRIPLQNVFKLTGVGTIAVGKVETGILKQGDTVKIGPIGLETEVKSIEMHHKEVKEALPGFNVGFNIRVPAKELKKGFVLGSKSNPAVACESFIAQIIIMNHPSKIYAGYSPVMYCHTAAVPCKLGEIISKTSKANQLERKAEETGKEEEKTGEDLKFLMKGDSAVVKMIPMKSICLETFKEFPPLGRFALRDMKNTVAVGIIKSLQQKETLSLKPKSLPNGKKKKKDSQ